MISVLNVTVATQPVFLLAAGFPQAGPELGLSTVGLGLLTAAFFLAAAVVSAPAGRVVERIGWPLAMRLTAGGAIATLLTIAAFGRSTLAVFVLLVVGACFYAFANPASNLALARLARPERQATFFGVKQAGIPGSTLLAGLAVPLVNLQWGWRWSYVVAAAIGLALLLLIPRRPLVAAATRVVGPVGAPAMAPGRLRRLSLVAALATAAPGALGTFTVSAAIAVGLSEAAAGWAFSIGGFSTIAARVVYGVLADRHRTRGMRPLAIVMGLGSVAMVVLAYASDSWFVPAAAVAFAVAWGWLGLLIYTVVEANRSRPAAASAVMQAGIFVGAGLGPLAFGLLVDDVGYRSGWLVVGAALALSAMLVFPMARKTTVGVQEAL